MSKYKCGEKSNILVLGYYSHENCLVMVRILEVTILHIIFSSTSSQVTSLDSGKKNGSIVLLIVLEPKFSKPY